MNLNAILEGVLFLVGDEGINQKELLNVLSISEEELNNLIENYQSKLQSEDSGLKLVILGGNYKLATKEEHKEYYQKLVGLENTLDLSPAALETLAIIVYNEPVTRIQVDEIRGVNSRDIIRKLALKGLICDTGRSELPGRPILYKTTKNFLDLFGLISKDDLPKINPVEHDEVASDLFTSKYQEE